MEESGITKCMQKVLGQYQSIRGKDIRDVKEPFWDVIVITAADEEQKSIFDAQVEDKLQRNELPKNLPIHVVSDPPGFKLGNGGSTLTAVSFLHEKYGTTLYKYKVLMIHAGGLSKRMPSTSILGKIFSPIPTGNPIYQMLDIKLAMYLPFIPRMPPGIFVACADDFLVYNLGDDDLEWNLADSGFTAFAHPSTLEIGVKHGVYVLNDLDNIETQKPIQKCRCLEVLQKPSEEKMYKKEAVLKGKDLKFADNVQIRGRSAYTDSCFFFGMDVAKKFVKFVKENGHVTCEIDAYGDFLQALGPQATIDYIYNTSNVTTVLPDLLPTREKIFNLLKGTEITLLLMNSSKFIHIGSTKEYINHFCFDSVFQTELSLKKDVFNYWTDKDDLDNCDDIPAKKMKYSDTSLGCVMHSVLPHSSFVSENSIVEYCHFEIPVSIGQNTIISNCSIISDECDPPVKSTTVKIPNNIFLHTVPVKMNGTTKYVTIHFEIEDSLKKEYPIESLPVLGKTVKEFCSIFDLDPSIVNEDKKVKVQGKGEGESTKEEKISLWNASIFPLADSATDSILKSLDIIKSVQQDSSSIDLKSAKFISMATILEIKDYMLMLNKRKELFHLIQKNC